MTRSVRVVRAVPPILGMVGSLALAVALDAAYNLGRVGGSALGGYEEGRCPRCSR